MPALTISTGGTTTSGTTGPAHGAGSHAHACPNPQQPTVGGRGSRSSSPSRPPVSPITPTLGPTQFPGGPLPNASPLSARSSAPSFAQSRPTFSHSQPDQVGIAPAQLPLPEPISFDDNPDVLALKSAISILQLQRARAQADMQALSRAKAAAMADPGAFVADLAAGRVSTEGDPLFSGRAAAAQGLDNEESSSSSSSSSSSGSDEDEDEEEGDSSQTANPTTSSTSSSKPPQDATTTDQQQPTARKKAKFKKQRSGTAAVAAWRKLPKPQTVVRCPPVNWSQYGVVGESLDKLHAEQVVAPSPGSPATLGPGATFDFRAATTEQILRGDGGGGQQQRIPQRLPGIAAPYTAGKDKIDKKPRGKR